MQIESIISQSLSEEIRSKGHQSIRFSPDGFSLLVADTHFSPVLLQAYRFGKLKSTADLFGKCAEILSEIRLLDFGGETTLVCDNSSITLIPESLYSEENTRMYLNRAADLKQSDEIRMTALEHRKEILLYAYSRELQDFSEQFQSGIRIKHSTGCLLSLADQVRASDHQRGMLMADVQNASVSILVIQQDRICMLNRFSLHDESGFIYHVLNTFRQLKLDRETIPVYLSGIVHRRHEYFHLLNKYIRNIGETPYYIESVGSETRMAHMLLTEAIKCA